MTIIPSVMGLLEAAEYAPVLEGVRFEGFPSYEWEHRISSLMEITGLPLDNVRVVRHKPGRQFLENQVVGHFNRVDGELGIYKALEGLPLIAQFGTVAHELGHSFSPLDQSNQEIYGGSEAQTEVVKQVIAAAKQTLLTGTFLNGYHKKLAGALNEGVIDFQRFCNETHAILLELRFTNPAHLEQVQEAQQKKLDRYSKLGFIRGGSKGVSLKSIADNALIAVMPSIESPEQLDLHIKEAKQKVLNLS